MNLYISKEQARSMRVEHCFACHKIRSIAFWQPTPVQPVILCAGPNAHLAEVKIQDLCTCDNQQEKE